MQIEKFSAENDWVIIEEIEPEEIKSESGIILQEKKKSVDVMKGKIVQLSSKAKLPQDVNKGSTVFFLEENIKYRFYLDSKEYFSIKYLDLLAVE